MFEDRAQTTISIKPYHALSRSPCKTPRRGMHLNPNLNELMMKSDKHWAERVVCPDCMSEISTTETQRSDMYDRLCLQSKRIHCLMWLNRHAYLRSYLRCFPLPKGDQHGTYTLA
jgi:hypothetical protein